MTSNSEKILYSANEDPGWWLTLSLAFMHIALIFDGIIFLPNMVGRITDFPSEQAAFMTFATLIVAAAGTLFQALRVGRVGCGFVLFMGSYSAFLACALSAVKTGGPELLATMTLLSAPIVFLYSYFLRFLRHIVTPQIGGVMIILVALSLMPEAMQLWQGSDRMSSTFGSYQNYLIGTVTIVVLVLFMLFGKSILRFFTPLFGLMAGCLTASFFGLFKLEHFHNAPWIGLPGGNWPGLTFDINITHIPLLTQFIMAALVSSIEGTGNIMLLQQYSFRNFKKVNYELVQGGLYCDGLGKLISGLIGGTPVATFCDNIPLLKMTRTASRRVGIIGALILFLLAFLPKVSGLILDLPAPVIGGMLLVICALLFFAGFGLVIRSGLGFQQGLILGLSLCAGLIAETSDFFPDIIPLEMAPILQNGVALGGFTAITLSTLLFLFSGPNFKFRILPRQSEISKLFNKPMWASPTTQ